MFDLIYDPFIIFLLSAALLVIVFTLFVNFARGLAIAGLSIGLVFYIFFAGESTKKDLNKYATSVMDSVKALNYVSNIESTIKSNITTISNKTYKGE